VRDVTIARNYASALFDLAVRAEAAESYGDALREVAALSEELPVFRVFLDTPSVPKDEKKRVLQEVFGGRVPAHVLNFLLLLLDRRRHRLIREISVEYGALLDDRMGRARVHVTVARELSAGEQDEIRTQLGRILDREAIPTFQVKKELLGGIVFRSGDTIFDGSVRRRLDRMRRQLLSTDLSTV
jgi:F-type H+-transporting ATPase subunit delta